MTTFDYSRAGASATRLIARFGRRAFLRKKADPTGDAWSPTRVSPKDWPITVVELSQTVRDQGGTVVEGAGHRLLVSTDGLSLTSLTSQDTIMLGESDEEFPEQMSEYEIAEVRPLSPGPVVILYEVDLAR